MLSQQGNKVRGFWIIPRVVMCTQKNLNREYSVFVFERGGFEGSHGYLFILTPLTNPPSNNFYYGERNDSYVQYVHCYEQQRSNLCTNQPSPEVDTLLVCCTRVAKAISFTYDRGVPHQDGSPGFCTPYRSLLQNLQPSFRLESGPAQHQVPAVRAKVWAGDCGASATPSDCVWGG